MNNYAVDPCGVRYLTVGDGGNIEGLYKTFAAQAGTCACTSVQSALAANNCPCLGVTAPTQPSVRCPPAPVTHPCGNTAPLDCWPPERRLASRSP